MVSSVSCPSCNTEVTLGTNFCPNCGTATPSGNEPAHGSEPVDTESAEHRERLQKALGDAFQLQDRIGRGGFADVYRAIDTDLKREVAIKVLRPELLGSPDLVERFKREAQTIANIRHPHIIPIYSVGTGEDLVYFVMPLIKGETLQALLTREEKLPIAESRRILEEVASALAEAHEHSLVHRDIKPENIMLEGAGRRALVMDFGIAKVVDSGGGMTMTGMVIGTPKYMSPEQASGDSNIDHRSDIYSLGVVAYHLFAGRPPFEATSAQNLLVAHLTQEAPLLTDVSAVVPEEVSDIVMRCLKKDPDERWQSAAEIAALLRSADSSDSAAESAEDLELTPPAATTRRFDLGFLSLGVLSLIAYLWLVQISPPPLSTPSMTRAEAAEAGRTFLTELGAAGSFVEAIQFRKESTPVKSLLNSLGQDGAREWSAANRSPGYWEIFWLKSGVKEEWRVAINDGDIRSFDHLIDDAAEGATLSDDEALGLAEAFLGERGLNASDLRLIQSSSRERANRTDHHFDWRQPGSEFPTPGIEEESAIKIHVDVRGDEIGSYRNIIEIPAEFARRHTHIMRTTLFGFAIVGLGIAAIVVAVVRGRRRQVRWKQALYFALAMFVVVLITLPADWGSFTANYSGEQRMSLTAYMIMQITIGLIGFAFLSGILVVLVAAGESMGRAYIPGSTYAYDRLLRKDFANETVAKSVFYGYAVGLIILSWETVSELATSRIPNSFHENWANDGYLGLLSNSFPFVETLGTIVTAVSVAFSLLFVLALLVRATKSRFIAIGISSVFFGLLVAPVEPWLLGMLGPAAMVAFLSWCTLRFGLVTVVIAVMVQEWVELGITALNAPPAGLQSEAIFALMLAMLPAALWMIAKRKQPFGGTPALPENASTFDGGTTAEIH